MTHHFTAPTVSEALPFIMNGLLDRGEENGSRNGRVMELLNAQIVLTDPTRREILTLGRKANVFAQIAETMWVLSGRNDIEWLSAYLPRAADYSDDGKVWRAGYGPRIRAWGDPESEGLFLDQLDYVINTLRDDPLSRQAVIAIWNPEVDTTPGKDKACNTFLQFQSRLGRLHLTVTVRSNDVMWGWSGINAFEWSTLQEIVASMLGMNVGELVFNIGSLHLYEQHWDKAARIERDTVEYDTISFDPGRNITSLDDLDDLLQTWFQWEAACRSGTVADLSLDGWLDEPLFKAWAAAIAYYWTQDPVWLETFKGTALAVAVARTPASLLPEPRTASRSGAVGLGHNLAAHERTGAFYRFVKDLHDVKHASYGDSWKKRGEKMSILANMARKVDRLGVGDEYDSSADTLIDLMVYAIKYECWLDGRDDGPENVNARLAHYLADTEETAVHPSDITEIAVDFNTYCDAIDGMKTTQKAWFISELARRVAPLARDVWYEEQGDEYRPDLGQ